ncbi:unnamed protein product, partial [Didymodactylos carnosus]
ALVREPGPANDSNTSAIQPLSYKTIEQKQPNTERQLVDIDSQCIPLTLTPPAPLIDDVSANDAAIFQEKLRSTLREAADQIVGQIFQALTKEFHIIVCGSPRVGKSTLINAICGQEVAETKDGLASCTKAISCHTLEGECEIDSKIIHYKYNFWDTPGFESWEKNDIRPNIKAIVKKPESKPLCMIFCASPGTFVNLEELKWLFDLCIREKHIFCALVCTNKYAGQTKSRRAVLDDFKGLLSTYVNDQLREEKDITFYGNVGLCTSVNSQLFEDDDRKLEASGIHELIYGIMESLVDEHVLDWCMLTLENKGFWKDMHEKAAGGVDRVKGRVKAVIDLLKSAKNGKRKKRK